MRCISLLKEGVIIDQMEVPQWPTDDDGELIIEIDEMLRRCGFLEEDEELALTDEVDF